MKEYIPGIFIALVLAAIVYLPNGMSIFKPINQPLTLTCQCEEGSMCRWYYQDQQSVPDDWVEANGDLNLPADDWTVYGGITHQCGSDSNVHTITVMNTGEVCNTCLQLYFTSPVDDICVGSVANVTISTNRSHSHGDAITLLVNGSVCSSNSHGNDVVRCREDGNVVDHTLSYTITPVDDGMVTMRAQTNYYGATWYSTVEKIIVLDQCNETLPTSTSTSSVPTTNVATVPPSTSSDDVITTNDNTSSNEVPTSSSDDGSSGGNASTVTEQPTTKDDVSGNMKNEVVIIIIIGVSIAALIIGIVCAIVIWQCKKRDCFTIKDQQDKQPGPVSSGIISCGDSSQISHQDCCC